MKTRNWIITQYITYLNIWWTLSKTLSPFDNEDKVFEITPTYTSNWCILLQTKFFNLKNITVRNFLKAIIHENFQNITYFIKLAMMKH